MEDMDFIAETMRDLGKTYLSDARRKAILASPVVAAPVRDDVDVAMRRRAIVAETMKVFGADADRLSDVYSRVWIACRNIKEGRAVRDSDRGGRAAA